MGLKMAETGNVSSKKKKITVTSPTKSVKFSKVKTPSSDKKKFAKTPHSSKTPVAVVSSPIAKKKRKLSFNNVDSSEDEASPKISPKKVKSKKVPKTPVINTSTDASQTTSVKKAKLKTVREVTVADSTDEEEEEEEKPTVVKKRKVKDTDLNSADKPAKKKKVLTEEQKLKEKRECTVFVGNLPTTITKEGITKAFSKFGKVRSARIRCIPLKPEAKNRKAGAILKQFSGQPAAAFVKFCNNDDAQKAVALNGTILNGNRIRVDLADPSKKRSADKKKAVFLRNLHFQLTDDELWQAFEDCGEIESVRIIKDRKTYLGRGLGYVNFSTTDAVELALKKDGSDVKGRPIKVQRCDYVAPRLDKKSESKKNNRAKEGKPKKDKKKKKEGTQEEGVNFTGNKTQQKKKIKKKLSADGLKKKKIAQVLAAKS